MQASSGRTIVPSTQVQQRNQAQQTRLRPSEGHTLPQPICGLTGKGKMKNETLPLPCLATAVPSASPPWPIPSNECVSRALKSSCPNSSTGSQNSHAQIWKGTCPRPSNPGKASPNERPECCPNASTLAYTPSRSSRATPVHHCICQCNPGAQEQREPSGTAPGATALLRSQGKPQRGQAQRNVSKSKERNHWVKRKSTWGLQLI